jgi:L-alanine-DL-glutamate epimerase-like enolase superfamily enzyme
MELIYKPFHLQFRHPFGVSSNTRKETLSIFIQLKTKSCTGYGEACLPAYLGESPEETSRFFEKAIPFLKNQVPDRPVGELMQEAERLAPGSNAAKAALDIALNDLQGKLAGKPYYELAGIGKSSPMATSFTIGIDTPEKLEQKIKEASDFSILKIKAGTGDDKQLIRLIRNYTDKPLYVDVNQGWKNKEEVLDMLHWLKDQGVILAEQPMPKEMKEEMRWVTQRSPLPTIADESVKRLKDLEQLNGSFSGINIKLMKCTGLSEALKMIALAREQGIKILLGCMAESSCGTSAMAQLMQLADYIDLDAPLLYTNDPFAGVSYKNGLVFLNNLPGIGAEPTDSALFA